MRNLLFVAIMVSIAIGSDFIPVFGSVVKGQYIPEVYGDRAKILFSNGISFDTRLLGKTGEPDLPSELKAQYQEDETGYYIVQFSGPIYGKEKNYLESIGSKVHFYIPNYGFVVSLYSKAQRDLLLSCPKVGAVWHLSAGI
ncbi:MAG: hypothetical protein N3A65_01480 [candidate division WOR-3 bacterium]|nr:hypothetical protein [candidate division WOR-3 bacterium]